MTRKKNTIGGLQIGGNVHITRGDFVGGDKNVRVDKGAVFVGGDVQGSHIVTGNRNQIGNHGLRCDDFFTEILEKIEQRSDILAEDKEDLKANVAEIKAETEKEEQADPSFLARRLRNIQRIAPDMAEVVLATLANPMAGFAAIVKNVARHAQKSAWG
ncbi:MAG TPA: hypothetical protein VK897_09785 [Anaerolineales bacterium]|nr:hypothetical protein [Anaerolineales bacterium]